MTNPLAPCPLCGEKDHESKDCYLFGGTDEYLGRLAPRPPDGAGQPGEPSGSPLPPTQFEEMFGRYAEPALVDVIDDEDYTQDETQLATDLLVGLKHINSLSPEDRELLDGIATRMATQPPKKAAPPPTPVTRPGIHTWQEMQEDGDETPPRFVEDDPFTSVNR